METHNLYWVKGGCKINGVEIPPNFFLTKKSALENVKERIDETENGFNQTITISLYTYSNGKVIDKKIIKKVLIE